MCAILPGTRIPVDIGEVCRGFLHCKKFLVIAAVSGAELPFDKVVEDV